MNTPKRKRDHLEIRNSREPSTESRRKQRRKHRKKVDTSEEYFNARRILEEREEEGITEYLVDWEDNQRTGQAYDPTWEPRENCTADLLESWEHKQRQGQSQSQSQSESVLEYSHSSSQSIHRDTTTPAKQRRVVIDSQHLSSQEQPASKRPRRAGTIQSARFQSVSQESIDLEPLQPEIPDTYEEDDQLSSPHKPRPLVIFPPVPRDLDREAYEIINSSSQSQLSQQSVDYSASLDFPSTGSQFRSHFGTPPSHRPYPWLEEPDSQELPGSASYTSSRISNSSGNTTSQNTQSVSHRYLEGIGERSVQWISSQVESLGTEIPDSQITDFQSQIPDATFRQHQHDSCCDSSASQSSGVLSSARHRSASSEPRTPRPSIGSYERSENSPTTYFFANQLLTAPAAISESHPSPIEQLPTTHPEQRETTLPIFPSFEDSLDNYSSSIPFQTQLPIEIPSQGSNTAPVDEFPSQSKSCLPGSTPEFSQHAQVVVEESETLQQDSLPGANFAPTESSTCNFGASWDEPTVPSSIPKPVQASLSTPAEPQSSFEDIIRRVSVDIHAPRIRSQSEPIADISNTSGKLYRPTTSVPSSSPILSPSTRKAPLPTTPTLLAQGNRPAIDLSMEQANPETPQARFGAHVKIAELMAASKAATAAKQAARTVSPFPPSPVPSSATNKPDLSAASNQILPAYAPGRDVPAQISPPGQPTRTSPEVELDSTCLKVLPQRKDVYLLPLPMVSECRGIYTQTLRNFKNERLAFLTDEVFERELVGAIDDMISQLGKICDHQDLIEYPQKISTARGASVEIRAKWAENVSTKCIFLAEFLPLIEPYNKHVIIMARSGEMTAILVSLLKWHGFRYSCLDKYGWCGSGAGGPMKVSIFPTNGEYYLPPLEPSLVIAFDETAESSPHLNDVRNPYGTMAPLISLVVTNSVEHLQKCFGTYMEPIERTIKIVSCLTQIGDDVGKLDLEQYPDPPQAAKLVADFVLKDCPENAWPIPPMPSIEGIESSLISTQDYDAENWSSVNGREQFSSSEARSATGVKRPSDEETTVDTGSPKRQKLTPAPSVEVNASNNSSESRIVDATPHPVANPETKEPSEITAQDQRQSDQISSLLHRIRDLEIQLRKKETTEINLRQINQDLESRCQNLEARCGDFESSIKAIQPKYQEALNDRGQFESDANTSLAREAQMRKERDLKDAELKKIQRQKAEVDSELAASRLTLASSTIPQIAELSNMKDEVERMTSENEKLKHRLNGMQKELEYIRTLYQNATNAATEATSEKRESQAEVADLREKADENKKRIHEIQRDTEIAAHLQRISELKAENEDLEREVEKKDAELKALSNGRRATRGASVPRSPRMGGTMSPGPARPIGRVIQMGGSGSRGNSPAPGDVGTGRTSFGEALFQGAPGPTARWGNHLQ